MASVRYLLAVWQIIIQCHRAQQSKMINSLGEQICAWKLGKISMGKARKIITSREKVCLLIMINKDLGFQWSWPFVVCTAFM